MSPICISLFLWAREREREFSGLYTVISTSVLFLVDILRNKFFENQISWKIVYILFLVVSSEQMDLFRIYQPGIFINRATFSSFRWRGESNDIRVGDGKIWFISILFFLSLSTSNSLFSVTAEYKEEMTTIRQSSSSSFFLLQRRSNTILTREKRCGNLLRVEQMLFHLSLFRSSMPTDSNESPNTISTIPLHESSTSENLLSSMKQINKLKRFLSTLYHFGSDISNEIGERVRALILALVVSFTCFSIDISSVRYWIFVWEWKADDRSFFFRWMDWTRCPIAFD